MRVIVFLLFFVAFLSQLRAQPVAHEVRVQQVKPDGAGFTDRWIAPIGTNNPSIWGFGTTGLLPVAMDISSEFSLTGGIFHITSNSITSDMIQNLTIKGGDIENNTIGGQKFASGPPEYIWGFDDSGDFAGYQAGTGIIIDGAALTISATGGGGGHDYGDTAGISTLNFGAVSREVGLTNSGGTLLIQGAGTGVANLSGGTFYGVVHTGVKDAVKDYGWVGDGVTDNTTVMNAAFADLDCQELIVPPGAYRWTGEVEIRQRTNFKMVGVGAAGVTYSAPWGPAGQEVAHLYYDGVADPGFDPFKILDCWHPVFEDLFITSSKSLDGNALIRFIDTPAGLARGYVFKHCRLSLTDGQDDGVVVQIMNYPSGHPEYSTASNEHHKFFDTNIEKGAIGFHNSHVNSKPVEFHACEISYNQKAIRAANGGSITFFGGTMVANDMVLSAQGNWPITFYSTLFESNPVLARSENTNGDLITTALGVGFHNSHMYPNNAVAGTPFIQWSGITYFALVGNDFGYDFWTDTELDFRSGGTGNLDLYCRNNTFNLNSDFDESTDWAIPGDVAGKVRLFWDGNAYKDPANNVGGIAMDPPAYNWSTEKSLGVKDAVIDYGWVGDGATDNTAAMNTAFADLDCQRLIVPAGVYYWTGQITTVDRTDLIIEGVGSPGVQEIYNSGHDVSQMQFVGTHVPGTAPWLIQDCMHLNVKYLDLYTEVDLGDDGLIQLADNGGVPLSRGVRFVGCEIAGPSGSLPVASFSDGTGVKLLNTSGNAQNEQHEFTDCRITGWGIGFQSESMVDQEDYVLVTGTDALLFNHPVWNENMISVWDNTGAPVLLTVGVDYTVVLAGDKTSATITMITGSPGDDISVIRSNSPGNTKDIYFNGTELSYNYTAIRISGGGPYTFVNGIMVDNDKVYSSGQTSGSTTFLGVTMETNKVLARCENNLEQALNYKGNLAFLNCQLYDNSATFGTPFVEFGLIGGSILFQNCNFGFYDAGGAKGNFKFSGAGTGLTGVVTFDGCIFSHDDPLNATLSTEYQDQQNVNDRFRLNWRGNTYRQAGTNHGVALDAPGYNFTNYFEDDIAAISGYADGTFGSGDKLLIEESTGEIRKVDYDDLPGGSSTPAGSDTQIQYNNGGAMGGATGFTFDDATGVVSILGQATGGTGDYDLRVGDVTTPDYGNIQFGGATLSRTSFSAASMDYDGAVLFRQEANLGAGNDPGIEFAFMEQGNTARFLIPESGSGNASALLRSVTIAGPYNQADGNAQVTGDHWTTNDSNLDFDTGATGADLFVQDGLEVGGTLFVDAIQEEIADSGVTIEGILLKDDDISSVASVDTTSLDTDTFLINEKSASSTVGAGQGEVWVKDDNPNTLWFTDDSDTDYSVVTSGTTYYLTQEWDAAAIIPNDTNGATATTTETTTNELMYDSLAFSAGADDYCGFWWVLPEGVASGATVKLKFYWTSESRTTGTTGTWGVSFVARADDEAIDSALSSRVTVNDNWEADGDLHISGSLSVALTGAVEGENVHFKVSRDTSPGTDIDGTMHLLKVVIEYPVTLQTTSQF